MSESIELKFKSKSGAISTIEVQELLEVDGRPYRSNEDIDDFQSQLDILKGQVGGLYSLLQAQPLEG